MSQRDFFVLTEEVHRVRAGDRAATQGMYADFFGGALAAHAFASIYRVEFAGGIHGVEQKLRRSARSIHFLVMVRFDDFDIEPVQRRRCV